MQIKDVRLPTHLKPLAYKVSLIPFIIPGNFTIKGSVVISLKAIESGANNITIHSIATNISHESGKMRHIHNILNCVSYVIAKNMLYDLTFGIDF